MITSLNQSVSAIASSASVTLADRVRRMTGAGRRIIGLQTGDPNFQTPPTIIEAAHQAMIEGLTHYSNSRGLPELRQALAVHMRKCLGQAFEPDHEIIITHGAVHGYYCAVQALLNPGDEILIPDPAWMTYVNTVTMIGARPVCVPTRPDNRFEPDLDAWERAVTSRTRAMVVNTPNNPTGAVYGALTLSALVALARQHNLWIISDDVYDHILYDGAIHRSVLNEPGARERTISLNSF